MLTKCRYPGIACDIPSVSYQFTWEPHIWPEYYSSGHEIWKYLRGIVEKYELMRYIKLEHKVTKAEWDDQEGTWKVSIQKADGSIFEDWCNVLLNAGGILKYSLPLPISLPIVFNCRCN
jgi:cation diffusion facilitator CzcD-associated flavoprotein CzcO